MLIWPGSAGVSPALPSLRREALQWRPNFRLRARAGETPALPRV